MMSTLRFHVAEVNNEQICNTTPAVGLRGIYIGSFMLCHFSSSLFSGLGIAEPTVAYG